MNAIHPIAARFTATGKRIAEEVLTAAWANLEFTADPVASSLAGSAADATKRNDRLH